MILNPKSEILYTFKIVIIGGGGVGKTCLFNRFCFNSFNFDTSMTIGINFHSINLKVRNKETPGKVVEKIVANSIFDFGGQDRFKPLIPKFIGGANGALLVFDLTNLSSLDQLNFWYEQLIHHADGHKIPKILVGSKRDLIDRKNWTSFQENSQITEFIKRKGLDGFCMTSSLNNYNVVDVFKELNNLMLEKIRKPYEVLS
ncbi:MAG: GTP-binding protein [Promethearchaeota archaeon]|nr:MAG: GTP-binding protein [Candidatus Lokiarchaeota archaeon]